MRPFIASAIAGLVCVSTYVSAQPNKQLREQQERCGKRAAEVFKRVLSNSLFRPFALLEKSRGPKSRGNRLPPRSTTTPSAKSLPLLRGGKLYTRGRQNTNKHNAFP
jgi:hypothetical protein